MAGQVRLDQRSPGIQYLYKKDKRLAKLISMVGPIEFSTHDNCYAFLVHEIIEQMLSIKAAAKIFSRLEMLCDGEITPERMARLSDDDIKGTGTSRNKVRYIRSLTDAANAGLINPVHFLGLTDEKVMQKLTAIHGLGKWTAKMYLIFVLNRPDVLPIEDAAFL